MSGSAAGHVIVICGGMAGLAAAHRLGGAGRRVTVLESTARLGGKLYTGDIAGVPVEIREDPALMRTTEISRSVGDPAKLKRTTGWSPRIDLADSLRDIYAEAVDGTASARL